MQLSRLLLAALSSSALVACAKSPTPAAPTAPAPAPPITQAAPTTAPSAPVAAAAKRPFIIQGRDAGSTVIQTAPDGSFKTTLHVVENGRGPHVDATFSLGPDGTVASLTASGHHTFGAKFSATFNRTGNRATWKSEEENGNRELAGPAFFLPIAYIPELTGYLVQAALRNGGTITILPAGTARVEKAVEMTITAGGTSRTVVGYSITGLGFAPTYTWMNPDGSWFGDVSEWSTLVPEGWDKAVEPLVAKQRELSRARDAALAQDLAHKPPAAGIAYTNARVLDVERGRWLAGHTVVVVGDTIAAVGPGKSTKVPAGAEVVDLAGKAVIPGMFDMHVHIGDVQGALHIASGVTTVRDVGNDPDQLDDLQTRYNTGAAIGPSIIRYGFIEGRNPKAASSKITAETPEEAVAGVKFYVDRKYDGIKIYNSVKPELVPIIAEAAHKAGLKVTGHIPVHMLAHEAVKAGYDGIEHINMLFLRFFATHETDTRDTTRFTLIGENAADFDLKSPPVREFIKLLADHKTIVTPTNDAFEDLLVGEQGKIVPGLEAMTARLPIQDQRYFLLGGLPVPEDKRARYKASFDKTLAMTKALYDAKVRIVAGTDAVPPGLMFHHELALYARAGIPNAAVLRIATLDAARYFGKDKQRGSIARGKLADLVVIDGDPLARIGDIANTVATMRGGIVYPADKVYASVGVEPAARAAK